MPQINFTGLELITILHCLEEELEKYTIPGKIKKYPQQGSALRIQRLIDRISGKVEITYVEDSQKPIL